MTLLKIIQDAIKSRNAVIGYRKSIKFIKSNIPKLIVVADNMPEKKRKKIEYNAKLFGIKVDIFDGTSKELGVICGKAFPIEILVIKG